MTLSKRLLWVICIFASAYVLFKTFPLKTISYDKIPKVGETFDEFAYAWVGTGILHGGLPVGWTTNLPAYKRSYDAGSPKGFSLDGGHANAKPVIASITFDYGLGKRNIDLVQPFVDAPPLAGVVYALGVSKNKSSLLAITAEDFRYINRYLTLGTTIILFVLAGIIYGPVAALLAVVFYSTVPTAVFISRLSMAENVLLPLLLLTTLGVVAGKKYKNPVFIFLAGVSAGLCLLTKFSGIAGAVTGLALLFSLKTSKKELTWFVLPVLICGGGFLAFGLLTYPQLFFSVIFAQAGRASSSILNVFHALSRIYFLDFPLDGWWTGGLIVLMYLAHNPKHRSLVIATLSYLAVVVILGGDFYAWYFFPLCAFYLLGYCALFIEIWETPNILNLLLAFIFPVLSSFYWGFTRFHQSLNVSFILRGGLVFVVLAGFFMPRLLKTRPLIKILWIGLLLLILHRLYLWNFRSDQYLLANWGQLRFPLVWNKNF